MLGLIVGVAAVSEKLRHAADVPGSVTGFRFPHRTAQLYAVRGDEHPRSGPQTASHFALRAFREVRQPLSVSGTRGLRVLTIPGRSYRIRLHVSAYYPDFTHTRLFQLPAEAEFPEVQVDES